MTTALFLLDLSFIVFLKFELLWKICKSICSMWSYCLVGVCSRSGAGAKRVRVDAAHLCLMSDTLFMFSFSEQGAGNVCGHELKKAEAEQDLLGPDFGGSLQEI